MHRIQRSFAKLAVTLALGGACFQIGSCDILGTAAAAIASINPCGTLLDCDPAYYQFITSGIDGPGVRADIDPFCTYPPFCGATQDPIFGGLGENVP